MNGFFGLIPSKEVVRYHVKFSGAWVRFTPTNNYCKYGMLVNRWGKEREREQATKKQLDFSHDSKARNRSSVECSSMLLICYLYTLYFDDQLIRLAWDSTIDHNHSNTALN